MRAQIIARRGRFTDLTLLGGAAHRPAGVIPAGPRTPQVSYPRGVLPAPAGPVTTVSGHDRAPFVISSVIRGRCTVHGGTSGAVIFDVKIGSPTVVGDRLVLVRARPAT